MSPWCPKWGWPDREPCVCPGTLQSSGCLLAATLNGLLSPKCKTWLQGALGKAHCLAAAQSKPLLLREITELEPWCWCYRMLAQWVFAFSELSALPLTRTDCAGRKDWPSRSVLELPLEFIHCLVLLLFLRHHRLAYLALNWKELVCSRLL